MGTAIPYPVKAVRQNSVVPKGGQRFNEVNLPGTERGNIPYRVASFTTE